MYVPFTGRARRRTAAYEGGDGRIVGTPCRGRLGFEHRGGNDQRGHASFGERCPEGTVERVRHESRGGDHLAVRGRLGEEVGGPDGRPSAAARGRGLLAHDGHHRLAVQRGIVQAAEEAEHAGEMFLFLGILLAAVAYAWREGAFRWA